MIAPKIKKFEPVKIEEVKDIKLISAVSILKKFGDRIKDTTKDIQGYATQKRYKGQTKGKFRKFLEYFNTDVFVVQLFMNGIIFMLIFGTIIFIIRRPINFPSEQMAKVFYVWNGRNTSLTYMTISIWVMVFFSVLWKTFNKKVQGTVTQSRGGHI